MPSASKIGKFALTLIMLGGVLLASEWAMGELKGVAKGVLK